MPNFELLTLLATLLHRVHCHQSHDDVCGWYYETDLKDPWHRGMAHNHWLQRADKVVARNPTLTLTEVQGVASQYGKAVQVIDSWSKQ